MSPAVKEIHAFDAAKQSGREPFKVADLVARRMGPQGNPSRRARDARPDGRARPLPGQQAARRRPRHGQPAHDDSDRRAHRDARRARRRRALGLVQHLLDAGSRGRGGRRRPARDRRHAAEPARHSGVRVEGRDAARILVVHGRSAASGPTATARR